MRSGRSLLLVSSAALLADACGGADKTGPRSLPLIVAVSSVQLQGVVGHAATPDPTIRVTDPDGKPMSGANVIFFNSRFQIPAVTGADGLASAQWQLEERAGTQTLTARLYDPKTMPHEEDVTFTAKARPDTVAGIYGLAADPQAGLPSQPVLMRPVVAAVDQYYNATPGVRVTFEVIGGGSVDPAVAITDSLGRASVNNWTLGADAGVDTLVARVAGLPPLYFTAKVSQPFRAVAVVAGNQSTCAIAVGGDVYCWGTNARGQIDLTHQFHDFNLPHRVSLPAKAVSISGGYNYTCAITDEAPPQAYCWGDNSTGQLGIAGLGAAGPHKVPVAEGLVSVVTGWDHACGLTPTGVAYCWGNGMFGQLGTGDIVGCYIANDGSSIGCAGARRVSGDVQFATLAAGTWHTCGVTPLGKLSCWGLDDNGQLGFSATPLCTQDDYYYGNYPVNCALTPRQVPTSATFAAVAAAYNTCMLDGGGAVQCYGPPRGGQIVPSLVPFTSMTPDAQCAIGSDSHAYCWATSFDVDGSFDQAKSPAPGLRVSAITSAYSHRCAILESDAAVVCWGNNDSGQLGNGTILSTSVPTVVLAPPTP